MHDNVYMRRALELAAKGKGGTSPNPMVGALVVQGDTVIAEGYHKRAGTPHAEVLALRKAGPKARGATLYVNLEPCCHIDKKTPPCTKTIIHSGIQKVVLAMIDPNPKVSGKGVQQLRRAGVVTKTGILRKEAMKLNEAFLKFITTNKPFVTLKIAQSLDGKIATALGESKWITGERARKCVHQMRSETDAVIVGIGTVIHDNPSLDCRTRAGRNPYRVIIDTKLQVPLHAKVLKHRDRKTIIATSQTASRRKIKLLENHGNKVLLIKEKSGHVDLRALVLELGRMSITSVMIEGGSSIAASALSSRIVDKVMFFTAPKIIGGTDAVSSVGGKSPAFLSRALQLKNVQVKKIGEDFLVEGYI